MRDRIRKMVRQFLEDGEGVDAVAVDKPSELKIALDNRTFEIQMFWQRSNYFLVLITAIGVAVFTLRDSLLAAILAGFGAVSSYFWYKTNLGSKFWHESWEVEVIKLAKINKIAAFERPTREIIEQVRVSLEDSWNNGSKSSLQKYLDGKILKKPSVSYYMILLSIVSTLVWMVVTVVLVVNLLGTLSAPSLDWSGTIADLLAGILRYASGVS